MITALFVLLLLGGFAFLGWFYGPQFYDSMNLKRNNARLINLSRQTKRDMDKLARQKDEW